MAAASPYWFRAKAHGWGWGIPSAWQGWVVFLVWLGAFVDGSRLLLGQRLAHFIFAVLMLGLLTGICYLKGEPPDSGRGRSGT